MTTDHYTYYRINDSEGDITFRVVRFGYARQELQAQGKKSGELEQSPSHLTVFLHGFTGCGDDWRAVASAFPQEALAIDLIGHGGTDAPAEPHVYTAERQVHYLQKLLAVLLTEYQASHGVKQNVLSGCNLIGYSMGARLALSLSIRYPYLVRQLVLESGTAGIVAEADRKQRALVDALLAETIRTDGVMAFVDAWLDKPLFASLKASLTPNDFARLKRSKSQHEPIGLINSLLGFGTGTMPNYWDELRMISVPTLFITGDKDSKFSEINRKMAERMPTARHVVIGGCGHNVHAEKPTEFISCLNSFFLP